VTWTFGSLNLRTGTEIYAEAMENQNCVIPHFSIEKINVVINLLYSWPRALKSKSLFTPMVGITNYDLKKHLFGYTKTRVHTNYISSITNVTG
jgi:hypothetical protein